MPTRPDQQFAEFKKQVAASLTEMRKKRYLTVPKLAQGIKDKFGVAAKGVSKENLYLTEGEDQDISLRTLYWLLKFYGVSLCEFFECTLPEQDIKLRDRIQHERLRKLLDPENDESEPERVNDRRIVMDLLKKFSR